MSQITKSRMDELTQEELLSDRDVLYAFFKRAIDISGSIAGLGLVALVYVPIAIVIKLDSRGPAIFSQERIGKDGRSFKLFKFRTMHLNSHTNNSKPDGEDERVTRVGRFLRRSSFDELPQFFNIFRGEMSLVGPRPEQLSLDPHYQAWQRRRWLVKPGLTGWWQVNGRKQPMHKHIDEDIYYIEHRSLRLDLLIIIRTIGAVLHGDGAV